MISNPFYDVQNLLNSYYEAVSCAQIDYEVEAGLVCDDGFRLIRKAISHIAVYIERDREDDFREARKCLTSAVLVYRSQLYADKAERIKQLLDDIEHLQHLMSLDESVALSQVRNRANELKSLEKDLFERDWTDASGVYTRMSDQMEDMIWELDDLFIALKSRNVTAEGGDTNG